MRSFSQLIPLTALILAMTSSARATETGFLNRTVKIGADTYRYHVYVRRDGEKRQKWRITFSLQGTGERGDDGIAQPEVGIGGAIRRYVDRFPAIVVMPQCRKDKWWTEETMQRQALQAL